jgi:quercetin dioxygenase-like cupin family protein
VRVVDIGPDRAHPVGSFGSRGLRALGLVRDDAVAVTVLHVAAGGEIARHPAPVEQLFVVASGRGAVSGADGAWQAIGAGQAVVWAAGEEHTTRAEEDLTAIVVELAAGMTVGG